MRFDLSLLSRVWRNCEIRADEAKRAAFVAAVLVEWELAPARRAAPEVN